MISERTRFSSGAAGLATVSLYFLSAVSSKPLHGLVLAFETGHFGLPFPARQADNANAGQMVKGREVIATTWLLNPLTTPADDWESTLVGMDYFTRKKPQKQAIEAAKKYGRASRALR